MWSTPDLSDVSVVLKGLLEEAIQTSQLQQANNIKVSCDSPETVRAANSQCHLTLYLLHIGRDPNWRNTPVKGPRPQLNSAQPLSLNLSYLLTAYCEKDFALEQRAMAIALQAIHTNPIMNKDTTPTDPSWSALPDGEFVISIEADTIEEMSRLWQAFTVPIRLSALIRASVIFIAPQLTISPPYPRPSIANLAVAPEPVAAPAPTLSAGVGQQTPPQPPHATLGDVTASIGPLVGVGGGTLAIAGNALGLSGLTDVFLSAPGGPTWDVTQNWRQAGADSELNLLLPAAYSDPAVTPPPGATPLPGLYNLTVGGGAVRSNAIPLVIAPRVDGVTVPPKLTLNAAGVYPIKGGGFIPDGAKTLLAIGATKLTYTSAAAPSAGEFTVDGGGVNIAFLPPAMMAKGAYPVLLSVNNVPASAGWVVDLP
jgi:hypothetical protein